jgi:translation initiation factor 2 alpha subunit (eIF-2alpha)
MGEVISNQMREVMSEVKSEVKSDKMSESALNALKIAFTYMPKSIEVTKYEYGDSYQKILDHIETVREILLINDVDPEEVYGEVNPESTPNSTY